MKKKIKIRIPRHGPHLKHALYRTLSSIKQKFQKGPWPKCFDVSHDIASSEKWCQCLDKKVQDFSVIKQNSNMRISK
jgi:hypothetical protein